MKVVTFGELMVRLQPFNYERFVQANSLEFSFGGGEANVAVSLANYGLDAAFVTKLPAHAIGQAAVNSLRRYGVDTSMITRGGDRVGIYYNEKGASQRGSVCIYDRANSAIQLAQPSDFDWDKIFEGVDWFHFTGITPALGENVVEICREACKAAKAHGVKISCDLNYRGKLWTRDQAREAMTKLCEYVDVCISNEEDAKDVFGIEAEATDIYGGKLNAEGYKSVAKQLADKFHFEKVAITLRESHNASENGWSAMLYDVASNEYCFSKKYELKIIDRVGGGDSFGGGLIYSLLTDNGWSAMLYDVASNEYCFSKKYDLHIIDRVGGGDSFGGGLIYALLNGKSTQDAVEFAVAASALKHTIEGDYNMMTVSEVEKLAGGDGSGRIQR
jgi:2-dehydro-3-deoxygluconokinase